MVTNALRQSFVYTTGPVALAAAIGAVGQFTLSILADADFECTYITGTAIQAGLVVANWGGNVQVDDSGRGRTLFNAALAFDAIAGNGRQPYPFNPPRLFRANSSIVITFTNNVATATTAEISFHGNKLYPGEELPSV